MKVGFTGSQQGMTDAQRGSLVLLLKVIVPTELHHGDCIGADRQCNDMVKGLFPRTKRIAHPADIDPQKRAYCEVDRCLGLRAPLERNKVIVQDSDLLIAAPKTQEEQLRSGTWATIRYARVLHRRIVIIQPDGTGVFE